MRIEREATPIDPIGGLVLPMAGSLRSDEVCTMLYEYDLPDDAHAGVYRWQVVRVVRGDREYDFPRILGPASDYGEQYLALGCGETQCRECTVDRFMADAESAREINRAGQWMLERVEQERPVYDQFIEREDQKQTVIQRNWRTLRSGFGLPTV